MKKKSWLVILLVAIMLLAAACGGGNNGNTNASNGSTGNAGSNAATGSGSGSTGNNSGGAQEQIELRMPWWGGQARHDRTLQVIELYESRNPHVKILPEYSGFDGYFDKLSTQFAAGNAPDIIQYGGNLNDYVARGVVLPLDDYVGSVIDLSKHSQSMIDAATFDGKFYGVTLGTNAFGVLINKTLFEEAGVPLPSRDWTWEDFAEISLQLSQKLNGIYGTSDFREDGFGIFLAQRGKVVHNNGVLGYEESDIRDWFQMWQDLRDSGAAASAELQASATQTPEQSLIVQRKVAMDLIAGNQYGAYSDATEDELVLWIAPYNSQTGKNGVSLRPSQFLSGYSETKYPEEVAKFLDFFVNDPEAGAILGNDRGAPVNSEVLQSLIDNASEYDQVIFSYIDWVGQSSDAPYVPNLPGYNEAYDLFTKTMEAISFGYTSVEDGAREYYSELQKILAKYVN